MRPATGPARAYHRLRDLIVRGSLAPGARLVEEDVAARLRLSRTPVRDALQRLAREGYVIGAARLRQSRLTVAPLTRVDAAELFSIVGVVEGIAARRAAELPAMSRRELATELSAINRAFGAAAAAGRPSHDRLFRLDEKFHRRYVTAGAGVRLLALHDAVKPQAERYERLYVAMLTSRIGESVREHDAIVRAIRDGEPEQAQIAVHTNWRNAATRLATVIDDVGELGHWQQTQ